MVVAALSGVYHPTCPSPTYTVDVSRHSSATLFLPLPPSSTSPNAPTPLLYVLSPSLFLREPLFACSLPRKSQQDIPRRRCPGIDIHGV